MSTWRLKTIGNAVEEAGSLYADREFLIIEDSRITYGEMAQQVDWFSGGLLGIGIKPGDKVAVWLPNGIEWVVAVFSLAKIGAVFVPVNNRFKTEEAEYILKQSDSSALIMIDSFQKMDYIRMAGELCPDLFTGESGNLSSSRVPGLNSVICVSEKNYPGAFSFDELFDKGGSCKTSKSKEKRSFRASEARPGIQDFQAVLDSGFRRNECAWE